MVFGLANKEKYYTLVKPSTSLFYGLLLLVIYFSQENLNHEYGNFNSVFISSSNILFTPYICGWPTWLLLVSGIWSMGSSKHPMYEQFYRSLKLLVSNAYNDNVGYVQKCFDIWAVWCYEISLEFKNFVTLSLKWNFSHEPNEEFGKIKPRVNWTKKIKLNGESFSDNINIKYF